MDRNYSIPLQEIRREAVVVNSRFIATLAPVADAPEARAFIARIKNDFGDAP
jgi:putative IMPACT (imprinted ancient) family translation regulator